MIRKILIALLLLSLPVLAEAKFDELVDAIKQQDDPLAVVLGSELEKNGEASFGLFYNLGLAHRNQGQNALARAYFERALQYSPRDLEVRRRLREAKSTLSPELVSLDVNSTPWWTKNEAQLLIFIPCLALFGLGIRRKFGGKETRRLHLGLLSIAAFGSCLLVALNNPPQHRAVVTSSSTRLLSEAKSGSDGIALPQGVLVEVVSSKRHFTQIKLGDDKTGWVRKAELLKLSVSSGNP